MFIGELATLNNCLNPEEVLTKVTRLELGRNEKRVFIDVHEIVAHSLKGTPRFNFYAVPHLVMGGTKEKYVSWGSTAKEALRACLEKLKDTPDFTDIVDIKS